MAFRVSVLLAILALSAWPASAQQHYLGIMADVGASEVHGHIGRRTTFVCPAVTTTQLAGVQIYGTDQYTYDSAVCIAAIHAGVLGLGAAGPVTIVTDSGADAYVGSNRNGVTSLSYGPYGSSYRFDLGGQPGRIDWITTAQYIPEEVTGPIVVECPSGGSMSYGVWGTGVYTIDSSICMAAVHVGAIPRDIGGLVAVTRMPGQTMYPPSVSNGVTSGSWGEYHASFHVSAGGPGLPPTPPPPPGPAPRVYVQASSIILEVAWPAFETATSHTVCRESPPGSACVPVTHEPTLQNDWYRLRDGPHAPRSMHAYRVSVTHSNGSVGASRASQENGDLGPPAEASVDFTLFAQRRQVGVSWIATGYVTHPAQPHFFQTHLVTGPGINREQVVNGQSMWVYPPPGLDRYEWQICSMMEDGLGGWWYSPEARVVTYSVASGTATHSVAPCTRLPEGDGTIIVPPPTLPGR